jgi:hypothetical protein
MLEIECARYLESNYNETTVLTRWAQNAMLMQLLRRAHG